MEIFSKNAGAICEDFVEYTVHPTNANALNSHKEQDLHVLRDECLSILSPYTIEYMWHQDPFVLRVKETYLHGRVRMGDNIEDEWYIISLLFKLTEIKQDLVVRVVDQDGEVLLIEAADYLPKWAQDPETSDNRVYIYQNQVHLIPVAQDPSQLTPLPAGTPNIDDAINTVHKFSDATRASVQIQLAIKQRMKLYPENWSDQKQFVHAIVPEKIKRVLGLAPKHLISAAIRCFYMRDVIDLRNCRTLKEFPPENLVKMGLTLSKCLYAMLVKQEFKPDRKSGWTMPPPSQVGDYKAADLGMKLSCGFEMLLAQSKDRYQTEEFDTSSIFDEVRYKKFEEILISNGYFKNQLKGSKDWTALTAQAKEYFSSLFLPSDLEDSDYEYESLSSQLKRLLMRIKNNSPVLLNESLVQCDEPSKQPDDDSWLEFEPGSFDEMLKKHFHIDENETASTKNSEGVRREEEIPSELKRFLTSMSNYEGVDSLPENLQNSKEINFDAKDFEKAIKKMVNINDDNNSSDIDSSDEEVMDDGNDLSEDGENVDPEWKNYTDQINDELQSTKVMASNDSGDLIESLDDLDKPINVDVGILKNILESYNSQNGMPGPASTLLQSLGVDIGDKS